MQHVTFCEWLISLSVVLSGVDLCWCMYQHIYHLTLEQTGFNSAGPFIHAFFCQYIHSLVLYYPQLIESVIVELWIWRTKNHLGCFYFEAVVNSTSMNIIWTVIWDIWRGVELLSHILFNFWGTTEVIP